jgi:hypothetical protein
LLSLSGFSIQLRQCIAYDPSPLSDYEPGFHWNRISQYSIDSRDSKREESVSVRVRVHAQIARLAWLYKPKPW